MIIKFERVVVLSGLLAATMNLVACTKSDEMSTARAVTDLMDKARPKEIANAYIYEGDVCPVDSSNPTAVSNRIAASKKLPFALNGWIVVDSIRSPVPPLVFAVLSSNSETYFLEGRRVPRPDVALSKGSHLFDQAGFEVVSSLSTIPAGEYQLSIATGTAYVVNVCKTKLAVFISE